MTTSISRLLQPKSVAVIGGGAWCKSVVEQLQKSGFKGDVWPVHPKADTICGLPAHPSVSDLPEVPDAAFVGINREATIGAIEELSQIGVGGAVCFASGFGETDDGHTANEMLLKAAGDMPILGPNCYGMINALDGACLWPDQHGCVPVDSGVAILTQSSNIAINLTMQSRALPIAYVVTCGNQAQLTEAEIASALLDDPRVTAVGLHIEGFKDLPTWQAFARKAHDKGIPVVALKVGKSVEAQNATISHTASLAGSGAGATALLDHLGIAQVGDLPTLIETLKILHVAGPLSSTAIASVSCSGGEASLIADMAHDTPLTFPPLNTVQHERLFQALGPKVALANPLDYHTYIWRDDNAMTQAFSAIIDPNIAITFLIVDFPRNDICDADDWECAINAAINTRSATGGVVAMVATLPELMPEDTARRLMAGGVIPLAGLAEALGATIAAQIQSQSARDVIQPVPVREAQTLSESAAKTALSEMGVAVPALTVGPIDDLAKLADKSAGPYVLKSTGLAHKSESGGVALSLMNSHEVLAASAKMQGDTFILEEMIDDKVAELLVGIVKDPAHGFVITIAAGGILTEILEDRTSLLVPASRNQIEQALTQLRMFPVLDGYRNQPKASVDSVLDAIEAIQAYVLANRTTVEEVEVNPLIVTPSRAVAADALIRKYHD
ncbi:acetate--CoA ligase family protein [Octadecabacter sp. 1_MG-2023]|uniref:acetate--CoA ligase family protein n=1 Tax=unclassified Octadecabacter TaxID=196158 RepID=UPI001C0A30F0|nr:MULTISPECIES: acetate--CoA ligase family protein [unclassified Octadecabacter]MBU2992221.1 acetate--CoA ligase family protein [Octadecabacter sp. B2R22]MDO6735023.1 acetate--CoA ligase family protein [Octadecabacter sp. 1_MG-2023]